jgi:hypothetical protein
VQHGSGTLGSIEDGTFLDYLSDLVSQGLCCMELIIRDELS